MQVLTPSELSHTTNSIGQYCELGIKCISCNNISVLHHGCNLSFSQKHACKPMSKRSLRRRQEITPLSRIANYWRRQDRMLYCSLLLSTEVISWSKVYENYSSIAYTRLVEAGLLGSSCHHHYLRK